MSSFAVRDYSTGDFELGPALKFLELNVLGGHILSAAKIAVTTNRRIIK